MSIYENALTLTLETVNKAYALSKELCRNNKIQGKELRDIVTDVDLFMEAKIIETLKRSYPNHYFSAEEAGEATVGNLNSDYYEWVIDPIDGTINYVAGLPFFTTSVCLRHKDELVLGAIIHHETGDMYTAIKGRGAFMNGNPIRVSQKRSVEESILSFMLTSHYNEAETNWILDIVRKLSLNVRGLRLLVSQAYELALIASGKMDGTVCIKSRGFSSSAGSLIVQEAGGIVSDIYGSERTKASSSLLVSNGSLHEELIEIING